MLISAALECAYCHRILNAGGRREGPDLSNGVKKGRTRPWLMDFIKDLQSVSAWSIMPKYELTAAEPGVAADFLAALDFRATRVRTLLKDDIITH